MAVDHISAFHHVDFRLYMHYQQDTEQDEAMLDFKITLLHIPNRCLVRMGATDALRPLKLGNVHHCNRLEDSGLVLRTQFRTKIAILKVLADITFWKYF